MNHLKSKLILLENKRRAHDKAIQIMRDEAHAREKSGNTQASSDDIDPFTLQVRRLEYAYHYSYELGDYATALKAQCELDELFGLHKHDEKKSINIEYANHDV